jgi:hypothetical protein
MDAAATSVGGGGRGRNGEADVRDAVMGNNMMPTPDQSLQNSMVDDDHSQQQLPQQESSSSSRPHTKSDKEDDELIHRIHINQSLPPSPENSQLPSQSPPPQSTTDQLSSSSPPRSASSKINTLLPSLHPSSPPPAQAAWTQTKSPPSGSNPFYTSQHSYRSSTPPIPSSAEQSPLISPAKRFSTGEVKPLYAPNSPRQPLNEEDRLKFSQVPSRSPPAPSIDLTLIYGSWRHS